MTKVRFLNEIIYTYSDYMKELFHEKVFRVGLSNNIICPHRKKSGGCIFCDNETFTGEYQSRNLSVTNQLKEAIPSIKRSCGDVKFLAYFQDETSTFGSTDFLKKQWSEALNHPEVIGLIVSTRPDYIDKEILEVLSSFRVPVFIEFGMQSIHEKSLEYLNRGHNFESVKNAINLSYEAGLDVGVHLIIGIPGETFEDMKSTIDWISQNKKIKQVKFHNLIAYENTKLGQMVKNNELSVLGIHEYIQILGELIPYLSKDKVVARLFTSSIRETKNALNDIHGQKTKWMANLLNYMRDKGYSQGCKIL